MSAQRNWFLWPLVTIPLASLPVLVNAVVWTILRRCLPGFPLFRAEDLAYYSLIVIGAFTLRRRVEPTLVAGLVIMTVLCASPLRSSRHDAIIPEADGPSQPGFQAVQVADAWEPPPPQPSGVFEGESQTVQMALILAVLVTVLVAVLARQLSTGPTPPTRLLWNQAPPGGTSAADEHALASVGRTLPNPDHRRPELLLDSSRRTGDH